MNSSAEPAMTHSDDAAEFEPGEQFSGETAEQLMTRLEKDPAYLQRRDRRRNRLRKVAEEREAVAKPIVQELQSIGLNIGSIDDLVKENVPLSNDAVAVLLKNIASCKEPIVCEMLVRGLISATEPFNGHDLTVAYDNTYHEALRFAILNTIACARPFNIAHGLKTDQPNAHIQKALKSLGY